MLNRFLAGLTFFTLLASAMPLFAAEDATLPQVYEAAKAGHLDQAQQMMAQVLRDHPDSAKAHYVEAELDAKQHQYAAARVELGTAERLQPGLPFAQADSLRALQSELGSPPRQTGLSERAGTNSSASFPWGFALMLVGLVAIVFLLVRNRRSAVPQYSPMVSPNGMPAGYGNQGMGSGGGGMGSGIVGGLASGLAVGAGVVAGEELAHHFLDGNRRPEETRFADDGRADVDPNAGMGGSDFGVADNGSWDDSGSGGGDVGGDDWS